MHSNTPLQVSLLKSMKELTKPLNDLLGINGFCYHKIIAPGKELMLSNSEDWFEEAHKHALTMGASYTEFISKNEEDFSLSCWPTSAGIEIIDRAREVCHWNYGITLNNDPNEFFGFSIANHLEITALNKLISCRNELEKFCLFFQENTAVLLNSAKTSAVIEFESPDNMTTKEPVVFMDAKKFEECILPRTFFFQKRNENIKITHKELLCLAYLTKGFSLQDIGEKLFISRRTVESHVNNVKAKLRVSSKVELLELVFTTSNTLERFLR